MKKLLLMSILMVSAGLNGSAQNRLQKIIAGTPAELTCVHFTVPVPTPPASGEIGVYTETLVTYIARQFLSDSTRTTQQYGNDWMSVLQSTTSASNQAAYNIFQNHFRLCEVAEAFANFAGDVDTSSN